MNDEFLEVSNPDKIKVQYDMCSNEEPDRTLPQCDVIFPPGVRKLIILPVGHEVADYQYAEHDPGILVLSMEDAHLHGLIKPMAFADKVFVEKLTSDLRGKVDFSVGMRHARPGPHTYRNIDGVWRCECGQQL